MPDTPVFFLINKSDIDEEAAALDADSDSEETKPRLSECADHSSNRVRDQSHIINYNEALYLSSEYTG